MRKTAQSAFNKQNLERLQPDTVAVPILPGEPSQLSKQRPKSVLSKHHNNYAKLLESKKHLEMKPKYVNVNAMLKQSRSTKKHALEGTYNTSHATPA